jgi:hypothetical protein
VDEEMKFNDVDNNNEHNSKVLRKNPLPLGDKINIPMDTNNKKRVIQIINLLDEDEQEDHETLLHEVHEMFFGFI